MRNNWLSSYELEVLEAVSELQGTRNSYGRRIWKHIKIIYGPIYLATVYGCLARLHEHKLVTRRAYIVRSNPHLKKYVHTITPKGRRTLITRRA